MKAAHGLFQLLSLASLPVGFADTMYATVQCSMKKGASAFTWGSCCQDTVGSTQSEQHRLVLSSNYYTAKSRTEERPLEWSQLEPCKVQPPPPQKRAIKAY
uniref:Putative secreted protein n=1 Tax=Amblyomma triste TaxID=251400 RepID=A0A023G3Z7_AMBTT